MKRRLLGTLLMLLSVSAQALTLEEWRTWQAETPAFQGRVQQSRWLPATELRVHGEGQVLYMPQQSLAWRWTLPQPRLVVFNTAGQPRELTPAGAQPILPSLSEAATGLPEDIQVGQLLAHLIQGNVAELRETYHLLLEGSPDAWQLVLLPRNRQDETVRRLVAHGGRFIESLTIESADGNELQLTLASPHRLVEPAGAQRLQDAVATIAAMKQAAAAVTQGEASDDDDDDDDDDNEDAD